jgi:hypothetical protein
MTSDPEHGILVCFLLAPRTRATTDGDDAKIYHWDSDATVCEDDRGEHDLDEEAPGAQFVATKSRNGATADTGWQLQMGIVGLMRKGCEDAQAALPGVQPNMHNTTVHLPPG